jgi:hypothetical protein
MPGFKVFPMYYRVLLHLSMHEGKVKDGRFPFEMTADGVADAVGRERAQSSISIKDLVRHGWATYDIRRLTDGRTRKVAVLTEQGRNEASRVRRMVDAAGIGVDGAIMAPPKTNATVATLSTRCHELQSQLNDLRRQVDSLAGDQA